MNTFEIIYLVSFSICLICFLISYIIGIPLYLFDGIFILLPIINTICAILYMILFITISLEILYRKIYFINIRD